MGSALEVKVHQDLVVICSVVEAHGVVTASGIDEAALLVECICLFILGDNFQIHLLPADILCQLDQAADQGGANA